MGNNMIVLVKEETYQEHFDDNSWSTPQEQIDAGYPIYIQPSNPTAQFVYTHDLGVLIIQGVLVTITIPIEQVAGTMSTTCTISTSPDDVTYTDHAGTAIFESNFRYVRVTLDFAGTDDYAVARVRPVRLRIALKKKRDNGNSVSDAALPVTITFNESFYDIETISVTAAYNAAYPTQAVYDFIDVPNPTSFDVYVFRTDTGAQVANAFSWEVVGA